MGISSMYSEIEVEDLGDGANESLRTWKYNYLGDS